MTPNLTRRLLYLFSFLDEVGPVYAMYSVWFLDVGISATEISLIFGMWAAISILLEVPSGALADLVDKRVVLAGAQVARALGIGLWFVFPEPWAMYVGAALWAVHSALASGAWEALIYEQLELDGDQGEFPQVLARVGQFSHIGVATGTLAGAALLEFGHSIPLLGWITLGVHALLIPILFVLRRYDVSADQAEDDTWFANVRKGAHAIADSRVLGVLAAVAIVLEAAFIFDDYVPALARLRGVPDEFIPLIVLVVWLGLIAGGELAARRPQLSRFGMGGGLLISSFAIGAAFALDSPWALLLVAVGYGLMNTVWVLTDARLVAGAPASQRATVRSFVGLVGGIGHIAIFAIVGALTIDGDPSPGLASLAILLAILGAFVAIAFPDRPPSD